MSQSAISPRYPAHHRRGGSDLWQRIVAFLGADNLDGDELARFVADDVTP